MPRTSDKAQRILEFVNEFVQENGFAPSVREIGAAVGLRSTASVSYHLQQLQEKGYLQSPGAKGRKRAIVTSQRPGQIPVVGVVTAGLPILATQNIEDYLTLPQHMVGHDDLFCLRVQGESMIEIGILDGDIIVVRQQNDAQNGEVVVAMIEDEATVKRIFYEETQVRLQPENRYMEPIYADNVEVLGKVVALFRQF